MVRRRYDRGDRENIPRAWTRIPKCIAVGIDRPTARRTGIGWYRGLARTSLHQPREVEIDAHVGSCLLERRELLGLSQADLASGLGVTCQELHKFETGANRISAAKLYQCAQILNSGIEYFFVGLPATSTRKKGRETTTDD